MEGTQCSQAGCNCHDFLPFECILCDEMFCLEHRSRFNHNCVIYAPVSNGVEHIEATKSGTNYSVKNMFAAVQNRFLGSDSQTKPKDHYNVKTSSVPSEHKTNADLNSKINKLSNISANTNSQRQKSISDKTRQMLIKSKALGNSEVPGIDRHFLVVHFVNEPTTAQSIESIVSGSCSSSGSSSATPSYFYFNRNISVAEMIANLKKNYSALVNSTFSSIPSSVSRDSLSLAITTEDSPDWRSWDRNVLLKDTFMNFEEIFLFPMELTAIVANQTRLQTAPRTITISNPIIVVREEDEERARRMKRPFVKGDYAWYHKLSNVPIAVESVGETADVSMTEKADGSAEPIEVVTPVVVPTPAAVSLEQEEMLLVSVVGVHHDDFPNVYYTIVPVKPVQFLNPRNGNTQLEMHLFEEKQTDSTHLMHLNTGDADGVDALLDAQLRKTLESLGDPVPIRISHGDANFQNVKIGNQCTISQLRQLVRIVTGVPVQDMKLICKGTVLKSDTQLIKSSKIVNGSKIIVMSSSGSK